MYISGKVERRLADARHVLFSPVTRRPVRRDYQLFPPRLIGSSTCAARRACAERNHLKSVRPPSPVSRLRGKCLYRRTVLLRESLRNCGAYAAAVTRRVKLLPCAGVSRVNARHATGKYVRGGSGDYDRRCGRLQRCSSEP